MQARCVAARQHYGCAPQIGFVGQVFDINAHFDRIAAQAARIGDLSLVIVDTLQAYFGGDDDNHNQQMLAAALTFRRLTELPGRPAVVVPCHPTKNARKDNLVPRGGSAFLNEVDGNLTLWRDGSTGTIHTQGKFRGPLFDPMMIEFETVTAAGLVDAKGRSIPTVLAKPVSELRASDLRKEQETREERALQAILDNPIISVRGLADALRVSVSTAHGVQVDLKNRNWIRRHARKWKLTDEGKAVLED